MAAHRETALEPAAAWQVAPRVGLGLGMLLPWVALFPSENAMHTRDCEQAVLPGWRLTWTVSVSVLLAVWWEASRSLTEHASISPEHFQCRPSEQTQLQTWLLGTEGRG